MMSDHDILIEINSNLKNLIKNVDTHIVQDDERFDDLAKRVEFNSKIIYGSMGVFVFVELIARFF